MATTVLLFASGCASLFESNSGLGLEEYDDNSTAHGAAYRVDAFQIRREMPSRPGWKPLEFYYKHCTEIGEASYYSKTSYECSGPY